MIPAPTPTLDLVLNARTPPQRNHVQKRQSITLESSREHYAKTRVVGWLPKGAFLGSQDSRVIFLSRSVFCAYNCLYFCPLPFSRNGIHRNFRPSASFNYGWFLNLYILNQEPQ